MSPEIQNLKNVAKILRKMDGDYELEAQVCDDASTLIADLEAKALSARAEALEEAAKWHEEQAFVAASSEIAAQESGSRRAENDYCDLKHRHYEYAKAIRALAQTQPPDVSKEI